MKSKPDFTEFAPAGRAATEDVKRQSRILTEQDLLSLLPTAVPCALVVLNTQRQIVYANDRFLSLVHHNGRPVDIQGQRPGEALGCAHAMDGPEGCGTSEFCSTCGAVAAVLASQKGHPQMQDCRITRADEEALDLRVWATPVTIAGEALTILAAIDISHEKRRQALERIFLHDIHNIACGLNWCIDFLRKAGADERESGVADIERLCRELNEEIGAQRTLLQAENGELILSPTEIGTLALLKDAVDLYRSHPSAHDRVLRVDEDVQASAIVSDRVLLLRVLCNLIKNALEASRPGQTVTAGCTTADDMAEFWVHNEGFMPRDVQLQIFQRSFSTKGTGRGLGTYSVRLLTERYLKGSVSFTSSPEHGTTFRVRYPRTLEI